MNIICIKCAGSGQITDHTLSGASGTKPIVVDCPTCNGRGLIVINTPTQARLTEALNYWDSIRPGMLCRGEGYDEALVDAARLWWETHR